MKKLSQLLLFAAGLLFSTLALAQGGMAPAQILTMLKDPHVSAESVDAVLPQLQALEKMEIAGRDSQQLALDIFLQAAFAYARNFHFKQGLLVYQGYLEMKDKFSYQDKTNAVSELLVANRQRQEALNTELTKKKSTVEQLQLDIDTWSKLNGKFSRTYSLVVILLTAVLALVFIRINMNTVRAKNNLRDNRAKMMEMQRIAALGRFHDGVQDFLKSSASQLANKASSLPAIMKEKYSGEQNNTVKAFPDHMKSVEQVERKMESLLG